MTIKNKEEVIFTLLKDEVSACAMELGISREQVAYAIIKEMRRMVDQEMGNWPESDAPVPVKAIDCPLSLDCYPSCAWWSNGSCTFQQEVNIRRNRADIRQNPYPPNPIDETSGTEDANTRYEIWAAGYRAGREDGRNIFSGRYTGNTGKPGNNSKKA